MGLRSESNVLERVPQNPLILDSTYGTHDLVSQGSKKNSDAQSHNENLVNAINENSDSANLNDKFL